MTDNQKKVLDIAKEAAPWKRVAERDVVFFARHLIDYGQKPDTFIPAIGKDVGPLGDASIDNNLYASIRSIENINNYLRDSIRNDQSRGIFGIRQRCIEAGESLHDFLKKSNFNNLKDDLLKFKTLYTRLSPFLLMVVFADKMLEEEIEKLIIRKVGRKDQKYFKNICYVRDFNATTREIIDLLKIAVDFKKNKWSYKDKKFKERLAEHEKQYSWLGARGQFEADWTIDDFADRVKVYQGKNPQDELDNILEVRDKAEEITCRFIDKYKLNKVEISLINTVKQFVYLRTYRTEMMYGSHSLVRPLLNKIADRLDINRRDILYLTFEEIIILLGRKKIDYRSRVKERKNGFYIIQYGDYLDFYVGQDMEGVNKLGLFEEHKNIDVSTEEIKGQTGWKGKVKGRVRIVKNEKDIKKVGKNDILVAIMTFPNFIPAMEQAAAFVTDEGGVLCHAAIIARELKKPCIIGTKIATKVFKDGDMVEVDAEHGIIKKVKQRGPERPRAKSRGSRRANNGIIRKI